MKKVYSFGLILLAMTLLGACQTRREETNQSSSSSPKQTEKASSGIDTTDSDLTSTTETSDSADTVIASDASYNGTYYYVQGKYGPVIIVNKKHPLSSSYAPGEDGQALEAFQSLIYDMQTRGFSISDSYSGFRSYFEQESLYNNYVSADGQKAADRYSARPGYSEHQTGLAFDIIDTSGNLLVESSAVTWLENNAHLYGFVVRYPEGKETVTGYMPESWHIRYIGDEATDIFQSGLTLEEYYNVSGGSY